MKSIPSRLVALLASVALLVGLGGLSSAATAAVYPDSVGTKTSISAGTATAGRTFTATAKVTAGSAKPTGTIKVTFNGKTQTGKLSNGSFSIKLTAPTKPGTYPISAAYLGEGVYKKSSGSGSVKVEGIKASPSISVKTKVKSGSTVTITVSTKASGKAVFSAFGKKKTVTVKNGKATYKAKAPKVRKSTKYKVSVTIDATAPYVDGSTSKTITVTR